MILYWHAGSSTQFSTALQMLGRRGEEAEDGMREMETHREGGLYSGLTQTPCYCPCHVLF